MSLGARRRPPPAAPPTLTTACRQIPQLLANYKANNADGLSMSFLAVWLLGDISNLVGACRRRLPLPSPPPRR